MKAQKEELLLTTRQKQRAAAAAAFANAPGRGAEGGAPDDALFETTALLTMPLGDDGLQTPRELPSEVMKRSQRYVPEHGAAVLRLEQVGCAGSPDFEYIFLYSEFNN